MAIDAVHQGDCPCHIWQNLETVVMSQPGEGFWHPGSRGRGAAQHPGVEDAPLQSCLAQSVSCAKLRFKSPDAARAGFKGPSCHLAPLSLACPSSSSKWKVRRLWEAAVQRQGTFMHGDSEAQRARPVSARHTAPSSGSCASASLGEPPSAVVACDLGPASRRHVTLACPTSTPRLPGLCTGFGYVHVAPVARRGQTGLSWEQAETR